MFNFVFLFCNKLICCDSLQGNTIWLILDIPISMSIWVLIKTRGIIYRNLGIVDNQVAVKKCLTVHNHHYVTWSNVLLGYGNRGGEFCKTCMLIHIKHKIMRFFPSMIAISISFQMTFTWYYTSLSYSRIIEAFTYGFCTRWNYKLFDGTMKNFY
jgi:hypothetical protein